MPHAHKKPWITRFSAKNPHESKREEDRGHVSPQMRSQGQRGRNLEWYNDGLCHAMDTKPGNQQCPRPAFTIGLCHGHYERFRKAGTYGKAWRNRDGVRTQLSLFEQWQEWRDGEFHDEWTAAHEEEILRVIATPLRDKQKYAKPGDPCPGWPDGFECDRVTEAAGYCRRCYQRSRYKPIPREDKIIHLPEPNEVGVRESRRRRRTT